MEEYAPHHHKGKKAVMLFILGLIIVLVRLYTDWDIWIVIGVLLMAMVVLRAVMSAGCKGPVEKA